MTARIDWTKADAVCGRLVTALRRREFPYTKLPLPQDHIPAEIKKDPRVHANFLFYCCHYMRGTIKSDFAIKRLVALWEKYPLYFEPHAVSRLNDPDSLRSCLRASVPYKVEEITAYWIENSRRLSQHWGADARAIFFGVSDSTVMYLRIVNKAGKGYSLHDYSPDEYGFLGFREKMASMLAYFLLDAELIAPLIVSPPVDFHLLRVLLSNQVIIIDDERNGVGRYEDLTSLGVEVLECYALRHRIDTVELGNALWVLSGQLCRRAIGNATQGRRKKGTEKTEKKPKPVAVDWRNPTHVERYKRTCWHCPVENTCELNVRSGIYYESGVLQTTQRARPPLLFQSLPHQRKPNR